MNKKYIDFVPVKPNTASDASRIVTVQTTQTEVISLVEEENIKPRVRNLGTVNDLNAKFVRTDVPKRPLCQKPVNNMTAGDALAALKAQKIKAKKMPKAQAKSLDKASIDAADGPMAKTAEMSLNAKSVYRAPKTQFINQEKVAKRPLSRNVYLKELEKDEQATEKHENSVMITSKTEKKSHWKTILAVIITIIVGAAAGVAAFLLLPK